jgi:hypothetical protein
MSIGMSRILFRTEHQNGSRQSSRTLSKSLEELNGFPKHITSTKFPIKERMFNNIKG